MTASAGNTAHRVESRDCLAGNTAPYWPRDKSEREGKAGLDAFARGLADLLHGTGVRVLLVRPGFVTGRMTAGLPPAPLATTPEAVGKATAAALRRGQAMVWVPPALAGLALALKLVPRPLWRRISR